MLPGTYVSLLADVVARWDIAPAQLLEGSGIPPERLQETFWYLEFDAFERLLQRAVTLTGESGLGVHLGMQMTVTCHGVIGFAAMVAKNLREAMLVTQQFVAQRCGGLALRLEVENGMASFYVEQPLPQYQLGEVGITFLLVGFAQMGNALTGKMLAGIGEVSFQRPDYFDRFEALLPNGICFGQPHNRLVFPASQLDLPLVMADPLAARLAREQCKRVLNSLVGGRKSFTSLVRELAYDEALGFCRMEEVAEKLHMSERTLQRQLAEEQQTFKGIVEKLREEKAALLLKQKDLSISLIAERLGYTDVANFTRAFKRWQGKTPSQYRAGVFR